MHIYPLTYNADSRPLFAALSEMHMPVWLDSSNPLSERGRYDILSAEPLGTFRLDSKASTTAQMAALNTLRQAVTEHIPEINSHSKALGLPFYGGAIGYLSYELGYALRGVNSTKPKASSLPLAEFGLYAWAIIVDHRDKRSLLIAHEPAKATAELVLNRLERSAQQQAQARTRLSLADKVDAETSAEDYRELFKRSRDYILAGDCYQINLARRFRAEASGSPEATYLQLRDIAAAPYSAYLGFDSPILSLSPERFIRASASGEVVTEPIKGTAARSPLPEQDAANAQQLCESHKDRAENLMIVDLLRNDLGQVCQAGSISVSKLFELQSFNTVHHLVSTVKGQLREDEDAYSLLAACFPGGSITGAPKKRAMEIIDELEQQPREVYCGSICYLSRCGAMDSNIAIRSLRLHQGELTAWAGSGLVSDSDPEREFEETWDKIGRLLTALEQ